MSVCVYIYIHTLIYICIYSVNTHRHIFLIVYSYTHMWVHIPNVNKKSYIHIMHTDICCLLINICIQTCTLIHTDWYRFFYNFLIKKKYFLFFLLSFWVFPNSSDKNDAMHNRLLVPCKEKPSLLHYVSPTLMKQAKK